MALVGALWPWRLTLPAPEQGLPCWRAEEVRNSKVAVEEGLDGNCGEGHDADILRKEGSYVTKFCELVNKVNYSFQVQVHYILIKTRLSREFGPTKKEVSG